VIHLKNQVVYAPFCVRGLIGKFLTVCLLWIRQKPSEIVKYCDLQAFFPSME